MIDYLQRELLEIGQKMVGPRSLAVPLVWCEASLRIKQLAGQTKGTPRPQSDEHIADQVAREFRNRWRSEEEEGGDVARECKHVADAIETRMFAAKLLTQGRLGAGAALTEPHDAECECRH